ncbi:MAG: phosphate acyltransferase PlsX [Candidatus Marinimicrobia bacterium]|nr:phosphate acyltransferase PlsX [Candidatus Neomarinimicrobiota bacterium]MBL7023436.1 phosphate acyltransferase PlsX [Candidatus Neomarinimicrobiota bacterium]MBL7108815.1 phosphate acyltransferase PlsX [Candidatus Neomarinimicrobiota bacterium]
MKIALDAMGGDHAPHSTVQGAFEYIKEFGSDSAEILLLGHQDRLDRLIKEYNDPFKKVSIIHAPQVVDTDEIPSKIFKTKPDSSLVKAVELVKIGEADAVVSSGNTGALMVSSLFLLGKIKGIRRPTLAPFIPTKTGGFILCDAGANTDVKPHNLVQFAIMAQAYIEHLEGWKNPSVALLNIGSEETKGNELTRSTFPLMKSHVSNFIGNIEARYVLNGKADVVVTDGFTGNILLKTIEGALSHMMDWFHESIKSHPICRLSAPLMAPAIKDLKKSMDYEEHGATPLLGVNGIAMKCHGSSTFRGIKSSLIAAKKAFDENLITDIAYRISEHLDIIENHSNNDDEN